jgi:hypothetical protein
MKQTYKSNTQLATLSRNFFSFFFLVGFLSGFYIFGSSFSGRAWGGNTCMVDSIPIEDHKRTLAWLVTIMSSRCRSNTQGTSLEPRPKDWRLVLRCRTRVMPDLNRYIYRDIYPIPDSSPLQGRIKNPSACTGWGIFLFFYSRSFFHMNILYICIIGSAEQTFIVFGTSNVGSIPAPRLQSCGVRLVVRTLKKCLFDFLR